MNTQNTTEAVEAPQPSETEATPTMTVRVINRGSSRSYQGLWIDEVTIAAVCPKCGNPRGEKYNHNFHEDGEWYSCDRWDNPCGHVDYYTAVLAEARSNGGGL